MKYYKLVLPLMIFGGLCLSAYGLISKHASKPSRVEVYQRADGNTLGENVDVESLNLRTAELEQKVTSLLKQLNQVKADVQKELGIFANSLASVSKDVNLPAYADDGEFSDPLVDMQQAEIIEEQQQTMIESTFTNEMIDDAWSVESTELIDSILSNEMLVHTDVIDRVCHSTLCRLEIQHQDQEQLHNFEALFTLQIGESFPELTMQHETGEDGEVTTVIFLAGKGFQLLDVETDE